MVAKKVAKRLVQCEKCEYKFESREARPRCGKCESYEIREAWKTQEQSKEDPSKPVEYKGPVTAHLSGQDLAIAEVLINAGLAKNFPDLIKKSLRVTAATANLNAVVGGAIMQQDTIQKKEPEDPEKEMDKMQARDIREMTIERMKEKLKKGEALDSKEILDLVKQKQYMKMLEDMDKEKEGGGFEKLIQLQMLQSLAPQNRNNNGDDALIKQVQDLQMQLREQRQDTKYQEILSKIEGKFGENKPGNSDVKALKDFMLEIEKIREKGRTDLEKEKTNVLTEVEKRKRLELDHQLKETHRKIEEVAERSGGKRGVTKEDIVDIKETISAAKDLSRELGGEAKKGKDAGDIVSDVITRTLDNMTPIVKDYAQKKASQPQPVYVQQPPIQPAVQQPQTQPQNPGPTNPGPDNPGTDNLGPENIGPAETTVSATEFPLSAEEEMANMMHNQQQAANNKKQQ